MTNARFTSTLVGLLVVLTLAGTGEAVAATFNAASPSRTDVAAAVTAASNGDTISIPAGSATWTTTLTVNKWLVFTGAGIDQTTITINIPNPGGSPENGGLVLQGNGYNQISGITFTGNNLSGARPAVYVTGGPAVRIYQCKFRDCIIGAYIGGPFGVLDHNQFVNCHLSVRVYGRGIGTFNWTTYYPISFASTNYLFIEDNAFTINTSMNQQQGDTHAWVSSGQGSSYVVRYNTFTQSTNMMAPAFDWHGDNGDGTRGNTSSQVYKNIFNISGTGIIDKFVDARGGQSLIYSNTVSGVSTPNSGRVNFREEFPLGTIVSGVRVWDYVTNAWAWANTVNGSAMPVVCSENCGPLDYHAAIFAGNYSQPYPHPLTQNQTLPNQPTNVTPINGATGQSLTPTLTLNAFSGPNPHVNSQFQVLQGASVIWNSGAVAASVAWTVPDGTLTPSTSYSWQGRYANLSGWSSYSTPTTFTTAAVPATPTNVAPANGATDQSFTPTLRLSAYSGTLPQTGAQFVVRLSGDEIWNSGTLGVVNSVVVPDGNLESNQTYSFHGRFQSSSGWSGYSAETTFTTTNTAPTGTIQWEVSGYSVPEAGPSVVLTATRTGGTKGILAAPWATANGTATAGNDYTASSGTVTFAAGDATPQTVTIPILNSGDFDTQNRTFSVTLTGATVGSPATSIVTIEMNPPPPVGSIGWTTATYQTAYNAGSKAVLAYRFGGDFGLVGASYTTLDGTAQAGRDYTAKSGTISFANGVTNAVTITITILNSGQTSTLPRYFFVNLSNPTGGASLSGVSSAMVAIDMPAPVVPPSVLIIQNPSSVIFQGGVIVTNR